MHPSLSLLSDHRFPISTLTLQSHSSNRPSSIKVNSPASFTRSPGFNLLWFMCLCAQGIIKESGDWFPDLAPFLSLTVVIHQLLKCSCRLRLPERWGTALRLCFLNHVKCFSLERYGGLSTLRAPTVISIKKASKAFLVWNVQLDWRQRTSASVNPSGGNLFLHVLRAMFESRYVILCQLCFSKSLSMTLTVSNRTSLTWFLPSGWVSRSLLR